MMMHGLANPKHSNCTALPEDGRHYWPKHVAVSEQSFVLLYKSETQ